MKFKPKEELEEMDREQHGWIVPYYKGWNDALDKAFKSFAERIEFYKKYRCLEMWKYGYPKHLQKMHKEQPDLYEQYMNENKDPDNYRNWNTWLFDHCFGDIK